MPNSPRAFISYSWDDEIHKQWVADLASDLRRDGVEAILDRWHPVSGDRLASLMAKENRDNDFVVVICTPNYRRKSEAGKGTVGFEGNIVTAGVAAQGDRRKFVPVLARGTWKDAAPSWVRRKRYADLSTKPKYAANYGDLIGMLLGKTASAPSVVPIETPVPGERRAGVTRTGSVEPAANRDGGGSQQRPNGDERLSRWAVWYGRRAMAIYTLVGLTIALLGLLYGPGILNRRGEASLGQADLKSDLPGAGAQSIPGVAVPDPGTVFSDCDGCPSMVVVSSGRFTMGSPQHEIGTYESEWPEHTVAVLEPFAVGVYEVTRGEYRRFIEESGFAQTGGCSVLDEADGVWTLQIENTWHDIGFEQTDSHPVSCISWNDATRYTQWLSDKTGATYRLLSEAEWEYAARGGSLASRYWEDGRDESDHCQFANFADSRSGFDWKASCDDGYRHTAPVGSYEANAFGLYDVMGNVWEWALDCWHEDYSGAPKNATTWEYPGCVERVVRGGSRYVGLRGIRSAHRWRYEPATRNQHTGFRVARSLSLRLADGTQTR